MTEAMCVNNLPEVAVDSASSGTEPAMFNRKSNAPSPEPLRHRATTNVLCCAALTHYCIASHLWDVAISVQNAALQ